MDFTYSNFLAIWQYIAIGLAAFSAVLGIIILIVNKLRVTSLRDYKQKYDYLGANDAKMVFYAIVCVGVAIALLTNTVYNETVKLSIVWFIVRMFIAVCVGTLIIYISYLLMEYVYPGTLEKKMKKWRYMPRVNKKTGNLMKLLSEDEEDVHLDEGMKAEENVFSIDYDVWVDETTGDVYIEKYPGHLIAHQCNSCGFKTMKLVKEEIITPPTENTDGEMAKHYQCTYCSSKRNKNVKIARLSQSDGTYKLPEHLHFKEEKKVNMVSIEVHTSNGQTKIYDFASTEQASDFLKEYKVNEE